MQAGGIGIAPSCDRGISIQGRQGRDQTHLRHQAGAQVAVTAPCPAPTEFFFLFQVFLVVFSALPPPGPLSVGKPLEGLNGPQLQVSNDVTIVSTLTRWEW